MKVFEHGDHEECDSDDDGSVMYLMMYRIICVELKLTRRRRRRRTRRTRRTRITMKGMKKKSAVMKTAVMTAR
jgi:hypothetical protein